MSANERREKAQKKAAEEEKKKLIAKTRVHLGITDIEQMRHRVADEMVKR